MKKHTITFLISMALPPIIIVSFIGVLAAMQHNNQWKTANQVYPIYGTYAHGEQNPESAMHNYAYDSVVFCGDRINIWPATESRYCKGTFALDTQSVSIHSKKFFLETDKNVYMQNMKILEFENAYIVLNEPFSFMQNTSTILLDSSRMYLDNQDSLFVNKYKNQPAKEIKIHLTNSSEFELIENIGHNTYKIYVSKNSILRIRATAKQLEKCHFEIYYDNTSRLEIPAVLIPHCKIYPPFIRD